jgi:acetyl esterase/lipase
MPALSADRECVATCDGVSSPRPATDFGKPEITFHQARSRPGRYLGPSARVLMRPLLEYAPLTRSVLGRAYLSDLLGVALPLPEGATAHYRGFGDVDAELVTGTDVPEWGSQIVLYFHGGAFIGGGLRTHRRLVSRISSAAGAPVLHVDYRQLPHATLAQTVDDCLTVYLGLLDDGHPPDRIVLAGDSAGGYLAFALAHRALTDGLPVPAGIAALSPWIDLTCSHSTAHPNARTDAYLPIKKLVQIGRLLAPAEDPLLGLLDADLTGMPPTLIQVGSGEVLRCDAELMAARLTESGVECALQIWDRQVHVFQAAAAVLPEGRAAITDIGLFLHDRLFGSERPSDSRRG